MKRTQEKGHNSHMDSDVKKNKRDKLKQLRHEDDDVEFLGKEVGFENFCRNQAKVDDLSLVPVSPGESGIGLPYAPENWPESGDQWRWKAGTRTCKSWYQDRFLYLPQRLQKLFSRGKPFDTKLSLSRYLELHFPGIDTSAFFASFAWKIPTETAIKGLSRNKNSITCLAGKELGFKKFCRRQAKLDDLSLMPVSPGESGIGLPYAPENWPESGDQWRWKVGTRTCKSWYQDRFLYLPQRLHNLFSRQMGFDSKPSLTRYLELHFPGIDTSAFFASFVWKIPTETAIKGVMARTTMSCIMQNKHTRTSKRLKATLDKTNPEVTIASPPQRQGESRTMLKCTIIETKERAELCLTKFYHYMELIWGEVPEEKKKSFTYLDPCYFLLYGQDGRKKNVVDWIKKQNVTAKRYVIIPSIERNHWRLFILCHSNETIESNNRIECMLLLDSLQARQSRYFYENRLRRLISDVYGMPKNEKKEIPLLVPKVPLQTNDKDCGYFVLYYIKLFIESAPEVFRVLDYPYFMTQNWFSSQQLHCCFNKLDQHHKTSISYEESSDDSACSSDVELIQFLDTEVSNAHSLP